MDRDDTAVVETVRNRLQVRGTPELVDSTATALSRFKTDPVVVADDRPDG